MHADSRLRSPTDIERTHRQGRTWRVGLLRLYARRTATGHSRIAFSVPGRLGSAVVRNRLRRRLREIVRLRLSAVPESWDMLLIAYRGAEHASFGELQEAVSRLWWHARLVPAEGHRSQRSGTAAANDHHPGSSVASPRRGVPTPVSGER